MMLTNLVAKSARAVASTLAMTLLYLAGLCSETEAQTQGARPPSYRRAAVAILAAVIFVVGSAAGGSGSFLSRPDGRCRSFRLHREWPR